MQKGNTILIAALVIITLVSVGAAIYAFTRAPKSAPLPVTSPAFSPTPTTIPSPSASPTSGQNTVVVFESEASIPSADKSQLQARVVNPMIDYYKMETKDEAASIKVKINTASNKADYPYLVEFILKSGANGGTVVTKTSGQINWWYPECLNGCNLSATFKVKYPEIADLVN